MPTILNQLAWLAASGKLPSQHDYNRSVWYKHVHETKNMLDQAVEVDKAYADDCVVLAD